MDLLEGVKAAFEAVRLGVSARKLRSPRRRLDVGFLITERKENAFIKIKLVNVGDPTYLGTFGLVDQANQDLFQREEFFGFGKELALQEDQPWTHFHPLPVYPEADRASVCSLLLTIGYQPGQEAILRAYAETTTGRRFWSRKRVRLVVRHSRPSDPEVQEVGGLMAQDLRRRLSRLLRRVEHRRVSGRERWGEEHQRRFSFLRGLLTRARETTTNASGLTVERGLYHRLLVVLELKAAQTLEAVEVLLKEGYAADAAVLTRSLFEIWIQAAYMALEPERRVRLYLEHDVITRHRRLEILRERGKFSEPQDADLQRALAELESQAAQLKATGSRRSNRWSGKTIREMAEEVGVLVQYETVYAMLSDPAHTSITSLSPYVRGSGDHVEILPEGKLDLLREVALLAPLYVLCLLQIRDREMSLGLMEEIDTFFRDLDE